MWQSGAVTFPVAGAIPTEEAMRKLAVLVLVVVVGVPAAVAAEDAPGIRASVERLAAETAAAQGTSGNGPSVAKRATTIALIAAGIGAVLAGNPDYVPSNFAPGNYPNRVNIADYLGPGSYPGHTYEFKARRGARFGYRWVCRDAAWCRITDTQLDENYEHGYIDGYDVGHFRGSVAGHKAGWQEGHAAGQNGVIEIINAQGLVVYDGPFIPGSYVQETFSDRKGMRYGGVGLIAVGTILNLVWPESPARLSAGPLRGGGHVGATFGF